MGSSRILRSRYATASACLLLIGCSLLLAACGSGNSSTSSAGSGSTEPTSSEEETTAAETPAAEETSGGEETATSGAGVTDYVEYIHGTAGAAKSNLSPVSIGFMNDQGGQLTFPTGTSGATAAVEYINKYLGGIDGHPLQLQTCFVATAEEEGQSCAYKFLADKSVKATVFGTAAIGSQAFLAADKGEKPVFIGNSLSPDEATAKNTFILSSSTRTLYGAVATYAKEFLHAKSAAIIAPNTVPQLEIVKEQFTEAGIESKVVTYHQGTADIIAPLTAAGAQSADVIMAVPTEADGCVTLAKSMESLGLDKPVLMVGGDSCFTPEVAKALGGELPEWTNAGAHAVLTDESDPEIKAYVEAAGKVGVPAEKVLGDGFFQNAWTLVMATARVMNEAGGAEATPETIAKAAKAFTGPVVLGAPEVKCGVIATEPNVCGYQSLMIQYIGNGEYKPLGGWLSPPGVE